MDKKIYITINHLDDFMGPCNLRSKSGYEEKRIRGCE